MATTSAWADFTPAGTARLLQLNLQNCWSRTCQGKIRSGRHLYRCFYRRILWRRYVSRARPSLPTLPSTNSTTSTKAVNSGRNCLQRHPSVANGWEVRYGFMGKVNVAIIEACRSDSGRKIYLTAVVWTPTICHFGQIIVELNATYTTKSWVRTRRVRTARPALPPQIPILQAEWPHPVALIFRWSQKDRRRGRNRWRTKHAHLPMPIRWLTKSGQNVADFPAAGMKRVSSCLLSFRCSRA